MSTKHTSDITCQSLIELSSDLESRVGEVRDCL